ncbi:MAG: DMT family transporter [Rhodospirillaceae bacterium]
MTAKAGPGADRVGLGIAYMMGGVLALAVLNVWVKLLSARYPILEIAFFRSAFALGPAALVVWLGGGRGRLRTRRFGSHLLRASVGLGAMLLMFWSYHLLPLADAVAIGFSAPLFLTALSVPLLGERVGLARWGAVLVGFAGVLVMARPGSARLDLGTLVALGAALGYALAVIAVRQLGRTEHPDTIVFYFTLNTGVLSALALPLVWTPPNLEDFGLLALTGLLGGIVQYCATHAFTLAPAAVIGPFNYSAILWATIFGWLIWGDLPDQQVILGAAVVIASGLFILYRETRRH